MSPQCWESMNRLRSFMFQNVYLNSKVKRDEDLAEVEQVIRFLYDYYLTHPEKLDPERRKMIEEFGLNEVVKDLVAGMTDRYAENLYRKLAGK